MYIQSKARTGAGRIKWAICIAFALITQLLVSCAPSVAVYLPGDSQAVAARMEQIADSYAKSGPGLERPRIVRDAKEAANFQGTLIRIGVSAGLVAGLDGYDATDQALRGKAPHIFDTAILKESGTVQALAFEKWGQRQRQQYLEPILWDPWGITGAPADLPLGDGKGIDATWWTNPARKSLQLIYAGQTPGSQTVAFWQQFAKPFDGDFPISLAASPKAWLEPAVVDTLKNFAQRPTIVGAAQGSQHFTVADIGNLRATPGKRLILESFSSQMALPTETIRRFRVLNQSLLSDKHLRHWIASTIVAASLHGGDANSAKAASAFVGYLLQKDNQRSLSEASGYIPADFRAPIVNAEAAEARKVAINADFVIATPAARKDFGGEAERWTQLLDNLVRSPETWEAIVRDLAKAKPAEVPAGAK